MRDRPSRNGREGCKTSRIRVGRTFKTTIQVGGIKTVLKLIDNRSPMTKNGSNPECRGTRKICYETVAGRKRRSTNWFLKDPFLLARRLENVVVLLARSPGRSLSGFIGHTSVVEHGSRSLEGLKGLLRANRRTIDAIEGRGS